MILFFMHKTSFKKKFSYPILINTEVVVIGMKPAPGDHELNFKKVGWIPYGLNHNGTLYNVYLSSENKIGGLV